MAVFPLDANWTEPFGEDLEFETTIVPFHADTEAREALRLTPHRKFTFLVSAMEAREGALVEALAYGGQATEWTVPYWRAARYLPVARSIGNTTLALVTTGLGYEIGESVVFWKSPYLYESKILSGVSGTTLTFAALVKDWPLTTPYPWVVPGFQALLSPNTSFDYVNKELKTVRLEFDLKVEAYGD